MKEYFFSLPSVFRWYIAKWLFFLILQFKLVWSSITDEIGSSNLQNKKWPFSDLWFLSLGWRVIYLHGRFFPAFIIQISSNVVIKRIVWHINGKVRAPFWPRNGVFSLLKIGCYHNIVNSGGSKYFEPALIRIRLGSWKVRRLNRAL